MCDVPVRFADILVIVIDEVSMISVYTGIGGVTRFKLKLHPTTVTTMANENDADDHKKLDKGPRVTMVVRLNTQIIEKQNYRRKTQQVRVQTFRGGLRLTTNAAKKAINQSLDKQNDDNGDRVSPDCLHRKPIHCK